MALAAPKPVEGAGLLLLPIARLSNVQAVRVVAALAPDNEAKIIVVMQTNLLISCFLVFVDCRPAIIPKRITVQCRKCDDSVTPLWKAYSLDKKRWTKTWKYVSNRIHFVT
jgi:hypothetical protein